MSFEWPDYFQPEVVQSAFGGTILSGYCIALEAWRRGLEVRIAHPRLRFIEVSDGHQNIVFDGSKPSPLTTREAAKIVGNKKATTDALRAAGVCAPETVSFEATSTSFSEVVERAQAFGFPVVLKPLRGSKGEGVLVGIKDEAELRKAYDWMLDTQGIEKFVLEQHFEGDDYRVYVVKDKYVAAVYRVPAHVVGDGKHTVRELIQQKNLLRQKNPFLSTAPIKMDFEVDSFVENHGYTYDSVLEKDIVLPLRGKANASAGGDVIDCTDTLPEHIQQAAIQSVLAIPGLAAAGVDILFNPSKPKGEDYTVIELNYRAHIALNMYPTTGIGRDVPSAMMNAYFPESKRLRTPGIKSLNFNVSDIAGPLKTGIAEAVTLTPIPSHGYPVRREFHMPHSGKISMMQKNKIRQASQRYAMQGYLNLSTKVLVAGGGDNEVSDFAKEVSRILQCSIDSDVAWKHPLSAGFHFLSK
ncbi:ATP-grasp domain-containing protein [Leucobacter chinensis]|uniref:ATP-grasp domain-containing protein n=1 Tax=Leucobacter chinensis TaxID=2851010 RepID=UPI001C214401|nr:ATP-grasp domain-containing protein [Leucobacter chinensis]